MQIECLKVFKDRGRLALMTHVIAGYPSLDVNRELIHIMANEGVEILEIQIPFSEPIADGPLFVKANQRAIDLGVELSAVLDFMAEIAGSFPGPVLMMGYTNTLLAILSRSLSLDPRQGWRRRGDSRPFVRRRLGLLGHSAKIHAGDTEGELPARCKGELSGR